jgi:hypothetical protein
MPVAKVPKTAAKLKMPIQFPNSKSTHSSIVLSSLDFQEVKSLGELGKLYLDAA